MAIVRVQENGKAQSGLKAGDKVVTGGGTYQITGVNSDGSYQSKKVNNETTTTYKGTYDNGGGGGGGGSKTKNSQYTGSSNSVKVNNTLQQAWKDEMNANSIAWYSADETERKRLEARNQQIAGWLGGSVAYNSVTGTWSGDAGGITQEDILDWKYDEDRPTAPKSDPRIDRLLDEILNRDNFSYDAMNDPLYQQYAAMYQREGERAMKNTMAEAAAGAGGMNTYAVTAAQQANSYYNSQLNDRIPELYQLAYNMYLKDIEGKVRDLGLLQDMDDTQYARYRDTMSDWRDDKNFAYGLYEDAVQQGNWQTNFDNNNYWANKNYDTEQYWANKDEEWKSKDYTDNRADIEYERTQAEEDEAKALIDWYIQNGVTTVDPETLAKAGVTQAQFNEMVAYKKQQDAEAKSGGSKGGGGGGSPKVTTDPEKDPANPTDPNKKPVVESKYFKTVSDKCDELVASGDEWGAAACAKEAFDNKYITKDEYNKLLAKCNPLLDITLGTTSPQTVFGI